MNDGQLQTIEQVRQFLGGSEAIEFRGLTAKEKYYWIEEVLIRFRYHRLERAEKGVIRQYIGKVTGYSRSQISRLIAEYKRTGQLKKTGYRRHRFPRKYTPAEVILLARTDELHGYLSGGQPRRGLWSGNMRFMDTLSSGIFPGYLMPIYTISEEVTPIGA